MSEVRACYEGSNGDRTKALYSKLLAFEPDGEIAVNLLRACKNSERAKLYKSGRSRRAAYDTKDWSISQLAAALVKHGDAAKIIWGWGRDEAAVNFEHVLYVEVPGSGQVSFHNRCRYEGPTYGKPWDGAKGTAPDRIIRFAERILGIYSEEESDVARQDRPEGEDAPRDAGGEVREAEEQQAALDL